MFPRSNTTPAPDIPDLRSCLAKTYLDHTDNTIHPGRNVIDHCCIVGEIAKQLITLYPDYVRERYFPTGSALIAAAHDIGKISPIFQKRLYLAAALKVPESIENFPDLDDQHWGGHQGAGYATLCAERVKRKIAQVVAKHHGFMPACSQNSTDEILGGESWHRCRIDLLNILKNHFQEQFPSDDIHEEVLTGLTTLADWIGSGCAFDDPRIEWEKLVSDAIESAGFIRPVIKQGLSFEDIFGVTPYPVQQIFYEQCSAPGTYLLEAPMGLGKTEAALYAAYRMLEQNKASGVYFALPTQLTSNKIHERFSAFLTQILDDTSPAFRPFLIHGNAHLSEFEIGEDAAPGGTWFSSLKRAILAPFGVGTIDQSLIAAIPDIRHSYMRSFGLLNKVVILDEVHSYDMYTGTILNRLIEKLSALNCTVIILSATVTKTRRVQLLQGHPESVSYPLISSSDSYPLISFTNADCEIGKIMEHAVPPLTNKTVGLSQCRDVESAYGEAITRAADGQQILWIENTVASAQATFAILNARIQNEDATIECGLLHSHFIKKDRDQIEKTWVPYFGKNNAQRHKCGRILVGTQILEQSLDIDADFLVTRLCPMDMFLQRLGRLWRHHIPARAATARREAWLLLPEDASCEITNRYNKGRDKSGTVYSPYILARTEEVLNNTPSVLLPGDIRPLIEATYAPRNETGEMLKAQNELEQKARILMQKACLTTAELGARRQDSDEDNPGTRYSEIETVKTLLVRDYRVEENGDVSVWFLKEDQATIFPKNVHKTNRKLWRQLAIQIDNNCLNIPCYTAPNPFKNEALTAWLKNYVHLGINNSQLRLARVHESDTLINCDFNAVSDKYHLIYNSLEGYKSNKVPTKEAICNT